MNHPIRRRTRLPNFDYSKTGYYFVTICTDKHRPLFSQITMISREENQYRNELSVYGHIAEEELKQLGKRFSGVILDKYVVMPNHIHAIFSLQDDNSTSLTSIVGAYKSLTSRRCLQAGYTEKLFQRSFHDHVIRSQKDYTKIWCYIDANPARWEKDCFYE